MKNDLTCGVIQDLLPSYVEGLLGEESLEAVERHLEGCPECANRRAAISVPAEAEKGNAKEVDYLKRIKNWSMRRVALAVFCTTVLLLGITVLKLFVVGTPLRPQSVVIDAAEDQGDTLYLSMSSIDSGNAFHSWKLETADGVTSIFARDVLASSLYTSEQTQISVPLKNIREVWLGGTSGRLLWQDGMLITRECLNLLALRTSDCEDTLALRKIAQTLDLQERLGNYTAELQTGQQLCGWTLAFHGFPSGDSQWLYMTRCEILVLALVDDLDFVQFRKSGKSGTTTQNATVDFADQMLVEMTKFYNRDHGTNWMAKASVKEYTHAPADFQQLLLVVDYYWLDCLGGRG